MFAVGALAYLLYKYNFYFKKFKYEFKLNKRNKFLYSRSENPSKFSSRL
jgi:hypothetical protein